MRASLCSLCPTPRNPPKKQQDGPYFGPLKCNEEYIGKSRPALVANIKEFHPEVRDYTITVLRERLAATPTALDHAAEKFYKNLWANGASVFVAFAVEIWPNGLIQLLCRQCKKARGG